MLSQTQYSFATRFKNGKSTNPEELLAAAFTGCFTMALSGQLGSAGLVADKLETTATQSFEKLEAGWIVTQIHLDVKGNVPKADQTAWGRRPPLPRPAALSRAYSTRRSRWRRS